MADIKEKKAPVDVEQESSDNDENEDTQKNRYLTFRLGEEDYGIEIEYVNEIIGLQKITEVPDMPNFVKGIINLRGRVIPVIDVRVRFHMSPCEYNDRTCVIVVNIKNANIGLLVDFVKEVINIPEENVSAPPSISKGGASRYVKGIGKAGEEVKILLDVNRVLHEEEFDQLTSGAKP